MFKNTHTHTHSQDNDCGDECSPVESSPATVNGGSLLLVHLPTTVATAATARQEETNYGHQDDVQDADGRTHQETHFIRQDLNTYTNTQIHTCHIVVCRDVKRRETSADGFALLW